MELSKYLSGKGMDVSKNPPSEHQIFHYFREPNNFYTLRHLYKYESLDFIYSQGIINETKFHRILIKEWLNFCKVKGYIIIEMTPNRLLSFRRLVKECELLVGEKGRVVEKEYDGKKNKGIIVLQKTKSVLVKGDSIEKWTFGIITAGTTDPQVDVCVGSILGLRIPKFEIIICGVYNGKYKKNKNVKFIYFDSVLPWITKKKNLICEKAKYENLAIIHDRYSFDKNWYEGAKKYGNYFEVLSCVFHDPLGRRAQDWITYGIPLRPFSKYPFSGGGGNMEYQDWDIDVNMGGYCVLKKSVWKKCPWDERLLLWQAEDMKISGDFQQAGFVPRFNPYSNAKTAGEQYGEYQLKYKFNTQKLGRPTSIPFKALVRYYLKRALYSYFGVYLKRPDAHNEMQRTFAVSMRKI